MPKVSIIIPCYNHGHYLREAVQSVLDQTFTDHEVIIVDDGSSDNTPEVGQGLSDPRIHYIWQANKGLPGARNTGIRASCGVYVAFLDADDWFLPKKLEFQAAHLDEHPEVGMVASGWIETDERGHSLHTVEPWHWKPNLELVDCIMGMPLVPNCVLLRRNCLDAVNLFDENLYWREDWDLWLRLLAAGCRIAWLPEIVCRYRMSTTNMSRNAIRMRDGGLAALENLFARPDLPAPIRFLRVAALAAVHTDAAARAYIARDVTLANLEVERAIELDRNLLLGNPCPLVQRLVGWSDSPVVGNEEDYLNVLARNLLSQIASVKRQIRKAIANRYIGQVFSAYRLGKWDAVRANLKHALRIDPAWLRNRGVLSITIRAYFPILRRKDTA